MSWVLAGPCRLEDVRTTSAGEVRCLLQDPRGRPQELLVSFESERSGLITRLCVRPILDLSVEIRPPVPADVSAITDLELAAPVRRDDGTEVLIDHNAKQFEHARVVHDHRWLGAFQDGHLVAIQGAAIVTAPIGGVPCRIAYNHYSRSDPRTRNSGNLIYLVTTLYRDIYPSIDQFISVVDVHNAAGLRLSFGKPWPTRVQRLFLPVEALAARRESTCHVHPFDFRRAAALLNSTHDGMHLWVPRTPAFLAERQERAPNVYADGCWQLGEQAVLAVWPSGERRTYRKDGEEKVRTLALVLDYGFAGENGRDELTALLCRAARQLVRRGISHLALFVSDDRPRTEWLGELAEASDTYALCAPELDFPPAPAGPVYIDHVLF
jgi:hypothetical protein